MSSPRVEPSEHVIFHPLHNELVLLNLKSQQYFALDDIGAEMWNRLVEKGDVEAVTDLLAAEYDVDRKVLRRDLDDLIGRLITAGLMKKTDGQRQTGAGV